MALLPPITGTPGDDPMDGDVLENDLRGGDGNDTITGLGGGDSLQGNNDDDLIYGGSGFDTLLGDDGNDTIHGGADNDLIYGGYGNDALFGNAGDDAFSAIYGNDTMYGGIGDDYFLPPDTGASTQEMYGGDGSDFFYVSARTQGIVAGGTDSGYDTLRLYWITSATYQDNVIITPDLATTTGMSLTISGIERFEITVGGGHDQVTTGDISDAIFVGAGANTVHSGGGVDAVGYLVGSTNVLDGGGDVDFLEIGGYNVFNMVFIVDAAGVVHDGYFSTITNFEHYSVWGGGNDDIVALGARADSFSGYYGDDSGAGGAGDDSLSGGYGDDTLQGDNGRDLLNGGHGNDLLSGGNQDDLLNGSFGNDTLLGENGADDLHGAQGLDVLMGGGGNDTLHGGAGADRLTGGDGVDDLHGGGGADRFVFVAADTGADIIRDMVSGLDVIQIAAGRIGNGLAAGAVDAAAFALGLATGTAGQFVYRAEGADGRLLWDANGSTAGGETDIALLTGTPTLAAADLFIFV